jgi:hypothetical protein
MCCGLAHRTVSGAPGPYRVQAATLGFLAGALHYNSSDYPCATGLSCEPARNGYLRATVDCKSTDEVNSAATEVRATKSEGIGLSGAARRQSYNDRLRSEP